MIGLTFNDSNNSGSCGTLREYFFEHMHGIDDLQKGIKKNVYIYIYMLIDCAEQSIQKNEEYMQCGTNTICFINLN